MAILWITQEAPLRGRSQKLRSASLTWTTRQSCWRISLSLSLRMRIFWTSRSRSRSICNGNNWHRSARLPQRLVAKKKSPSTSLRWEGEGSRWSRKNLSKRQTRFAPSTTFCSIRTARDWEANRKWKLRSRNCKLRGSSRSRSQTRWSCATLSTLKQTSKSDPTRPRATLTAAFPKNWINSWCIRPALE